MKKKPSEFFDRIQGCPLAMRHGWMRQAVQSQIRGNKYTGRYDGPVVMIFYGGGETNLCNLHHRQLAKHMATHFWNSREWIAAVEPVAALTDAISMGHAYENEPHLSAMGYSLFSREIFASSIVQLAEMNRVDAAIIITGCDKTVAGGLLAASWLKHLPVALLHGGTIRSGCASSGRQLNIETATEAAGMLASGQIDKEEHDDILLHALPSPGGCGVMATSNTMAVIGSTLGISLLSSASTPAMKSNHEDILPEKLEEAVETTELLAGMLDDNRVLGDAIDRRSFDNACTMLHAIGGSTNAAIHLPAIAEGFGVSYRLNDIRGKASTPVLLNLMPTGQYVMADLYEQASGLTPLIRYMVDSDLIDSSAMTVAGKTIGELVCDVPSPSFIDQDVIRPITAPVKPCSSLVIVNGDNSTAEATSIAPMGCVFKLNANQMEFEGPARVFDDESEAVRAVMSGRIVNGDIIVLRYQGVSVGCPELLRLTSALSGMGSDSRIAVLTDGRLSGVSRGTLVVHVEPEAWRGGPIALIKEGDKIRLDGPREELFVQVDNAEMVRRKETWQRPPIELPRGPLRMAAQLVQPLAEGALWWPSQ